jgi:hypothetical protein
MKKFKDLVRECFVEILKEETTKEELTIPSSDGTSDSASEEAKQKAKNATKDGEDVKFVKPGELEESGSATIQEEEVAPKVSEVFATLQGLSEDVNTLNEFAETSKDKKMEKLSQKLAKHLHEATKVVAELKEARDSILAEDAEKANVFGDKVVKALGKYCKDEKNGSKIKEKYMPYIAKAHKKGKKPAEVAERIKDHRFTL